MSTDKGVKLDQGKLRIRELLIKYFPRALRAVTEVSEFGAEKYCVGGWLSVEDGEKRYGDALVRHLTDTEDYDAETHLLHDAHAAWNALAVLELRLRRGVALKDDRIMVPPSGEYYGEWSPVLRQPVYYSPPDFSYGNQTVSLLVKDTEDSGDSSK